MLLHKTWSRFWKKEMTSRSTQFCLRRWNWLLIIIWDLWSVSENVHQQFVRLISQCLHALTIIFESRFSLQFCSGFSRSSPVMDPIHHLTSYSVSSLSTRWSVHFNPFFFPTLLSVCRFLNITVIISPVFLLGYRSFNYWINAGIITASDRICVRNIFQILWSFT